MTKTVNSVNGWIREQPGWRFIRSDIAGSFYLLTYANGDRLRRIVFNQDGREVFVEEWSEIQAVRPVHRLPVWKRLSGFRRIVALWRRVAA